jgi:2-oxoisovalerate dehydrogenase E2 component (dihydrolipoyl transacylase)
LLLTLTCTKPDERSRAGPDDTITAADVQRVARALAEVGPLKPLRGGSRSIARRIAQAHAEVVPLTLSDDADIEAWRPDQDITLRLIRALVCRCRAEPSLNARYDAQHLGRRVLKRIELEIAVDSTEGLFVRVLRDSANRDRADLSLGLDAIEEGSP